MLYRDLVQFEPIESVIRLREADSRERAADLVRTYVISAHMGVSLIHQVMPQLDISRPRDDKGVLVVGNYGTGKSHLMAVLAAVAEYPDMVDLLTDDKVAAAARDIAGRFKVVRIEVGAVERKLRDILCGDLEHALEKWGTPYRFPPMSEVSNNKDLIIEAVAGFQRKYPNMGILLVVDELLDYLRSREERDLILDLGFLRELGEVSSETAFRFIGGLQETLFDSPRFGFVADQLRRVRDRFVQVLISREDIAYVIANRLLKKDDAQKALIRGHLRPFEPLYSGLSERADEFVSLFPIHPAYIQTFQDLYIAEKRQVLMTFSRAMQELINEPVPDDRPGLVSFDHYWPLIQEEPALRSISEVATVIDKSNVLESLIRNSYTRPAMLPMARRVIHALSVHRLTTDDINLQVGLTAEALRDGLFLHQRLPEPTAEFLLGQVQVCLREIMRTVQGQFISYNEVNGQYYIDVKKDVDFDATIDTRAEMLGSDVLNRYFYEALAQAMNLSPTTYVTNYRIWFYELPWAAKRVTRPGYLFLGLPSDRSTAQPPRDFYVYLLPPFGGYREIRDERPDEVILSLQGMDEQFERRVRLYAGARDLAETSAQHRREYGDRANDHLRRLVGWLREHLVQHLVVRCQGDARKMGEILAETRSSASEGIREVINLAAAHCLEPIFDEAYPHYPAFTRATDLITEDARDTTAMQAIRGIAGLRRTALADAVLDGLRLFDAQDNIRPYDSPYARHLLALLELKPENQVVNRSEVLDIVAGGVDRPIVKDIEFSLEPPWVAVVMAALIYSGDIEATYGSKRVDAGSVRELATMSMSDLIGFRHYQKPPSVPVGRWVDIFETLELPPGLVRDENSRPQAIRDLQRVVGEELERIVSLEHRINQGLSLWHDSLFTDTLIQTQGGVVIGSVRPTVPLKKSDVQPYLRAYKSLLERLKPFDTPGKMRNLSVLPEAVADARKGRADARRLEHLVDLIGSLQGPVAYLATAGSHWNDQDSFADELATAHRELMDDLRRMGNGERPVAPGAWPGRLAGLKDRHIKAYAASHRRAVLGPVDDDQREALYRSEALRKVLALDQLNLLPSGDLGAWKRRVTDLAVCREFHEGLLQTEPVCPRCRHSPRASQGAPNAREVLNDLVTRLDQMLEDWQQAVLQALESDVAIASLEAMTPAERRVIETFQKRPDAPTLPEGFVDAANKALSGIESLPISLEALEAALREGGLPCTVAEFRERLFAYLQQATRGRDESRTRLTLQ